jgi:hypothetical protein
MSEKWRDFVRKKPEAIAKDTQLNPDWQCYCCQDTGRVNGNIAEQLGFIPADLEPGLELPAIRCQAQGCNAYRDLSPVRQDLHCSALDWRQCDAIADFSKQDWHKTFVSRTTPKNNQVKLHQETQAIAAEPIPKAKAEPLSMQSFLERRRAERESD